MRAGRGVAAISLAGGRSSRFGRDKLAEPLKGRSLLQHAIDGVRPYAEERIVVAAPGARPQIPADVRLVHDPSAFEGPLLGLFAALAATRRPRLLVVAGDMPWLAGPVLAALLDALDGEPAVHAAMLEQDGEVRPLPMALSRERAAAALSPAIAGGERRLRAIAELLPTAVLAEADWRRLDPTGATTTDVDTPADLP
jgi:molybdopterin-guanine dinucleotide biosynthesis protein A